MLAPPLLPPPSPVRGAQAFVDSIGLATHWNYLDTPYGRPDDALPLLKALGVRHVRDGLHPITPRLGRMGIRLCALLDVGLETIPAFLARVKAANAEVPGTIDAVEGPNEPDLFWKGKTPYNGQGFPAGAVAAQRELYRLVRADPALGDVKVIGPSLGATYDPGGGHPNPFRPNELESAADWGNFHPYGGGNPFSASYPYAGLKDYYRHGNAPSGNLAEFPFNFTTYAPPYGKKPMAATECGYSTNTPGPGSTGGVTERTHAKYIPRVFAEGFRLGIVRSYAYEFLDEFPKDDDREARFGLLRRDLSPKPAYTALRSLIALVGDPAAPASFVPKSRPVPVSVGDVPGYDRKDFLHSLQLVRRDGTVLLLLWHDVSAEDATTTPHRELIHPDLPVTLDLSPGTQRATVYRYAPDWTLKPTPTKTRAGTLNLPVNDTIVVVGFKPGV